jgi:hypothetical protein
VGQLWTKLSDGGRRRYLKAIGLQVYVCPDRDFDTADTALRTYLPATTDRGFIDITPTGLPNHYVWMIDFDPAHTDHTLATLQAM